jgi:hypothetical protein
VKLRDVAIGANASIYYKLDFKRIKGVFYPRTTGELSQVIKMASEKGLDITMKGGGSGLSGACTGGDSERVMVSTLQMNDIISVNLKGGYADVETGVTPDELNARLGVDGYKLWVAPSSRDIATVGGLISTDGGGNDAWVNGTMRDNTIWVKMLLSTGDEITVSHEGVRADDSELEARLNEIGMNLGDVASAHGTLGAITKMRLKIKPIDGQRLRGGIAEFEDANALGNALAKMIDKQIPIAYGESIVYAHPHIKSILNPPLLILEYPEASHDVLSDITNMRQLSRNETDAMKAIRLQLPKRNPNEGVQIALFEGYGFHDQSLARLQEAVDRIHALLMENEFVPFAQYGHAPSKWYLGDNTPAYGIIMHSREIQPADKSGIEKFKVVKQIVNLCKELDITPKPEHKWIFSDKTKLDRLRELRSVVGTRFNSFVLDPNCDRILEAMA